MHRTLTNTEQHNSHLSTLGTPAMLIHSTEHTQPLLSRTKVTTQAECPWWFRHLSSAYNFPSYTKFCFEEINIYLFIFFCALVFCLYECLYEGVGSPVTGVTDWASSGRAANVLNHWANSPTPWGNQFLFQLTKLNQRVVKRAEASWL